MNNIGHQTEIFRLNIHTDKSAFVALTTSRPDLEVIDNILPQMHDLIKILRPAKQFTPDELNESVALLLDGRSTENFGCWVYYPWSRKVVHFLDEIDFILVRTNRNKYKITEAEQTLLASKTIGLIGLSVGHSVALSLALERNFGELRIADHDVLDLSNLNRIQTGVENIGLPKTTIVARTISEMDPFLKVVCYPDGVTNDNMDDFLASDGGLDLLIDECDSLDIKIAVREKAKLAEIPVIMATSDRGMLDIERFDLDSSLPILHGFVEGLNSSNLVGLTNEEKIPYVLPILGLEQSSLGLRTSMFEIEKSISTWPQLGSDVVFGAGCIVNISRRILLGETVPTGRTYLDMADLIPSSNKHHQADLSTKSLQVPDSKILREKCIEWYSDIAEIVPKDVLSRILTLANMAPSGGNTQPWLWHTQGERIFQFLDTRKPFAFLDFKYRGSMVALGAAAQNLELAAQHEGYDVEIKNFEFDEDESFPLVALFNLKKCLKSSQTALFDQIQNRLTNRLNEGRKPLPSGFLNSIADSFSRHSEGSQLKIVTDPIDLNRIKDLLTISDRLVMMNTKGHQDLFGEISFDLDHGEIEGINVHDLGLTDLELAGMQIARDPRVIERLQHISGGDRFGEANHKAIDSSSAIGLVTMGGFSAIDFFRIGLEIQRMWLEISSKGVSLYPFTGMVYLINRINQGGKSELSSTEVDQLNHCNQELQKIFKLNGDETMSFLFRLAVNKKKPRKSNRKPVFETILTS